MEKGQGQAEDAMASGLAAGSSRSRSPKRMNPISIGYPPAYAVGVITPCANETSSGEPLATGEPSTPHPEIKQEGRHREAATALEKTISVPLDLMQDNANDHDMKSFAAELSNMSETFIARASTGTTNVLLSHVLTGLAPPSGSAPSNPFDLGWVCRAPARGLPSATTPFQADCMGPAVLPPTP